MKTKPMAHQSKALELLQGRDAYALFMEQGTGKTWVLLADAERLHAAGKLEGVLVLAPNGVHTNWLLREAPAHLSAEHIVGIWRSGAGKKHLAQLEEIFSGEPSALKIASINYDALLTKEGFKFAERFVNTYRCVVIADESSRIKNPTAGRTKRAAQLRERAAYARIATGTPVTNSPVDVFSQMQFLRQGLLGTDNYRVFVSTYAELLPPTHPLVTAMIRRNPRAAHAQIVARDSAGQPRWKNLDKLQSLLQPHSYRVLKSECLDLPEKIYSQQLFELPKAQRRLYDETRRTMRLELGGNITTFSALSIALKLQQITSGFVILPSGVPYYISDGNARLKAFEEYVQDLSGPFIVWARFRAELQSIACCCKKLGISSVEYHGEISRTDREAAVDRFQTGEAQAFIGQPQAGGLGLTLTAAETVIYYSNDYNLETRLQSEDRAHRIGTKHPVLYVDLVALDTIDERISEALRCKEDVAAAIMGDFNHD